MVTGARVLAIGGSLALCSVLAHAQRPSQEWLTWGSDIERTGWNRAESALSKKTVAQLTLKWKTQIDMQAPPIEIQSGASMLTGPLVAQGVRTAQGTRTLVYTLSSANTLAALDAGTGAIVWQRKIENIVEPANPATWLCTNTSTATPVIDKASGTIYMIAADGRLYGLDLATGERKMAAEFVPSYSRNWSLNLVDGFLYTTAGRGCGNGTGGGEGDGRRAPAVAAQMLAMDLKNPGASDHALLHQPGAAQRRVDARRPGLGLRLVLRADGRRPLGSGEGAVGADASAAVAEDVRGDRLLHAAESRRDQREGSRLRLGRHDRLHVREPATGGFGGQGRHRLPPRRALAGWSRITARQCSRSRPATTRCRTHRTACGALRPRRSTPGTSAGCICRCGDRPRRA